MGLFNTIEKKILNILHGSRKTYIPQPQISSQQINTQFLDGLNDIKSNVNIYLLAKFFDISNSKSELVKEIDEDIKPSYIAQLIANRIIEDALTPLTMENFYNITIHNLEGNVDNTLTEIVRDFLEQVNIKNVLLDIAYELLFYGEYYLRLEVIEGEGIVNVKDDVDITTILPVFRDSNVSYFLKYKAEEKKVETALPNEFAYFYLPNNRIRVKTNGLDDKVLYVRMGRSFFYPVIGLIKELMFLEKLLPTALIQKMNSAKLVGIAVPPNTPPTEAINITKIYQKMIDNNMFKQNNYTTPDDLLKQIQNANRVKIIPVWGDGKGELRPQDLNNEVDTNEIQDKIQDLRELIMRTLGLPVSLVTIEPELKTDIIKNYSAYVKKLKNLQQSIQRGLIQIIYTHLTNIGYNISTKQISINFVNTIDTEALQKLEINDVNIAMFENLLNFVDNINEKDNIKVNEKEIVNLINKMFKNNFGFNFIEYEDTQD